MIYVPVILLILYPFVGLYIAMASEKSDVFYDNATKDGRDGMYMLGWPIALAYFLVKYIKAIVT